MAGKMKLHQKKTGQVCKIMDKKLSFKKWLYSVKQLPREELESGFEAFCMANDILHSKKEDLDFFEVSNVKEFNSLCNKWLKAKMLSMQMGSSYIVFCKIKTLYVEFIRSDYFMEDMLQGVEIEYEEPIIDEEDDGDIEEIEFPEVSFDDNTDKLSMEEQQPPRSFVDALFDYTSKIAYDAIGEEWFTPAQPLVKKQNASQYFDLVNEIVGIKTVDNLTIEVLDHYANLNGKAYKCDKRAVRDFANDSSTYRTLFRLNDECVKNRILESAIKDVADLYKSDVQAQICLMPDLMDEFNKDIKTQIHYNGKRLFQVPRSVAVLFADVNYNGELPEGDYYVIDMDGDEPSVVQLQVRYNEEKNENVIVRRGLKRIKDGHRGYSDFAELYLKEYSKKYGVHWSKAIYNTLKENKIIQQICRSRAGCLIPYDDEFIVFAFDEDIYNIVQDEIDNEFDNIIQELSLPYESVYKVSSLAESGTYDYTCLLDACLEIERRLIEKETLWEEYLPKLSLEVIQDGKFGEVKLIKENEYRDILKVLDGEEVIQVNGVVTLEGGKNCYQLPLSREVIGKHNSEKMAFLSSKSFPLDNSLQVRMEIHYRYGDEDSYKLVFYPLSKDAPFSSIENEWRDVERIESISKPQFEAVSHEMTNEEIEACVKAISDIDGRLNSLFACSYMPAKFYEATKNKATNLDEANFFGPLNWRYKERRKLFSMDGYKNKNKRIIETLSTVLKSNFIPKLLSIVHGNFPNKDKFGDNTKILRANAERILIDFGAIYELKTKEEEINQKVNNVVSYFLDENKLWQLAPLSRCVIVDKYGIFDAISERILEKCQKGKLDINDLRSLSSNCWQSKEWISNLYSSQNGYQAITKLIEKTCEFVLKYDLQRFIGNPDPNPRLIRDVLELLLCLTRANELAINDNKNPFFDPNSLYLKDVIAKIKLIDSTMEELKDWLKYPFNTRLGVKVDQHELYKLNPLSYMLIQTLTGQEEIQLIGFTEE